MEVTTFMLDKISSLYLCPFPSFFLFVLYYLLQLQIGLDVRVSLSFSSLLQVLSFFLTSFPSSFLSPLSFPSTLSAVSVGPCVGGRIWGAWVLS